MAVPIKNIGHLRELIKRLIERRRVFVYVLFDERASQQKVADFLDQRFDWLNSLADASNVYILFFLRGKVKGIGKVVKATGDVQNPSLQVAQWFGINPKELPCIVIFSAYKIYSVGSGFNVDEGTKYGFTTGIYLPLKIELFSNESTHLEEVFADLFSILQKHQKEFKPYVPEDALGKYFDDESFISRYNRDVTQKLILGIKDDVNKLRRRERLRPFIQYLNGGVINVAKLPAAFLNSLAIGFGTELAKIMSGKI